MKIRSIITCVALIPLGIGLWYVGRTAYEGAMTIHQLLTENKQLKQAITNLTAEEQSGYAKVSPSKTWDEHRLAMLICCNCCLRNTGRCSGNISGN